jgi:hypothetical protein
MAETALLIVSVGSSILGGFQAKANADAEAAQYEENARLQKSAGLQDEAERQRELATTLAEQEAILGSRGISLGAYSSSSLGVVRETRKQGEQTIRLAKISSNAEVRRQTLGANMAKAKGKQALVQSFFSAGKSILGSKDLFSGSSSGTTQSSQISQGQRTRLRINRSNTYKNNPLT